MKKLLVAFSVIALPISSTLAQNVMTPELLWQLGRVNGECLSPDGKTVYYTIKTYVVQLNGGSSELYMVPVNGGEPKNIDRKSDEYNIQFSPSGKMGYLCQGNWYEANPDGSA